MTDFEDWLNFNNTNDFLNTISGPFAIKPDPLDKQDETKWNLGDDFEQQLVNDYSDGNNGSVLSTNEFTPLSNPSSSSTHTSPENFGESLGEESLKSKPGKIIKPKKDKVSHNMIEKKYRTNINSKILMLRDTVPSLRIASGSQNVTVDDLEGLTPAAKLNKASVLTKATEYIKHLETKNQLLKQQNSQLSQLIAMANNSLPQIPPSDNVSFPPDPITSLESTPINSQFVVDDDLFGFDPMNVEPLDINQVGSSASQNSSNKYLLGGIAAVVGTSMFGGESDFRGLSSVPFFPSFLWQTPYIHQFWLMLKLLLVLGCLSKVFGVDFNVGDKKNQMGLVKSCLLVTLGVSLPKKIDDDRKLAIIQTLRGHTRVSFASLVQDYLYLTTVETTFENVLLNLLVGCVLIKQHPFLKSVFGIGMSLRYSLLLNLTQVSGNEGLVKLNKLIKDVDGTSLFSSNVISRLTNLVNGKSINHGITDGDYVKYVDIYRNTKDLYELIFNWRLVEIIFDLNCIYLNNCMSEESNEAVVKDIKCLESLLNENTISNKYLDLFKTAILPQQHAVELMKTIKRRVDNGLHIVNVSLNGIELTDTEISDDDSSTIQNSEETDISLQPHIKSSKEFISALHIVSQDEFIVLVTSLIQCHHNDPLKLAKLVSYLSISSIPSLLSFTSIYNVLDIVIPCESHDGVLDNVIRVMKEFLASTDYMDRDLTCQLNDVITKKGILLNGGE